MKLINNTRYCTEDLQAICDLAVRFAGPSATAGHGFQYNGITQLSDVTLVFAEHNIGHRKTSTWLPGGGPVAQERMYVKRQSWVNPHKVYIMNTELVETNTLAMLTMTGDRDGWVQAPEEVIKQLLTAFCDRVQANERSFRSKAFAHLLSVPMRLRYRIGAKVKATSEAKAADREMKIRSSRRKAKVRTRRSAHELILLQHQLILLDKLAPEADGQTLTKQERKMFDEAVNTLRTLFTKLGG
jgi:hypothetical protein